LLIDVTGLGISWAVVAAEALVELVLVLVQEVQEGGEAHDSADEGQNN
jgi:hypothetical protein